VAGLNVAFLEQTSNSSDIEFDKRSGRSFPEGIGAREKKFWSVEVSAYFQTKFKTLNVHYRLSILSLQKAPLEVDVCLSNRGFMMIQIQ
jgi:hypothetical protein